MRKWFCFAVCYATFFVSYAQDSTHVVGTDTTQLDQIKVTPYYSHNVTTSSTYVNKFGDRTLLQFSAGTSILNVLRGRVPGLSTPPYVDQANLSGIRTGRNIESNDALLVIDGIAFNTQIGTYLNLNTFDFSSISAFSSTGALNFLGGFNSGAFVLRSKTGEGITKPQVEVSSYTTYSWRELQSRQPGVVRIDEWGLTNAVAFSQDFGMVDTRISYTNQKRITKTSGLPYVHSMKLNTGLVVGDRFDLRLIADGRFTQYDEIVEARFPRQQDYREKSMKFFGGGNLTARFKLTSWLVASSQLALHDYDEDVNRKASVWGRTEDIYNSRRQANFFLNASKRFAKGLNISGATGIQYVRQNVNNYLTQTDSSFFRDHRIKWEDENPGLVARLEVDYREIIVLSSQYLIDKHSAFVRNSRTIGLSNEDAGAHTISSAFIFSKLIGKPWLSFGKVRSSFGTHSIFPFSNYPESNVDLYSKPVNKQHPYRARNTETGVDLGFFHSRLSVTLNYFRNQERYVLSNGGLNGIDRYQTNGWEADIRFKTKQKKDFSFESGVVFCRSTSKIGSSPGNGRPFSRVGWSSLITYKTIVASTVIESLDYTKGDRATTYFDEFSFAKLRDVSIGFRLPAGFAKEAILSVSGRNLVKLGGSGVDPEQNSPLSSYEKSTSLNLNLTF